VIAPLHVLDNPVWSALTGPQSGHSEVVGDVARYRPEMSLFGAFADLPGPRHWTAMAELVGPGGVVITTGPTGPPPQGWTVEFDGEGVQMTGESVDVARPVDVPEGTEIVRLGADDVADMLELVALTRPGPFAPDTWELGGYVGVRRGGRLVAMAGERMRPVGWAEISAVATHPDHRREGLGELLVRVVAAGIRARGELPLLHASSDNTSAIRLYEAMGFAFRRTARFQAVRAQGVPSDGDPDPVTPHH
jgi:ribosomal protein S18 acetylase RimI-like enzyme